MCLSLCALLRFATDKTRLPANFCVADERSCDVTYFISFSVMFKMYFHGMMAEYYTNNALFASFSALEVLWFHMLHAFYFTHFCHVQVGF